MGLQSLTFYGTVSSLPTMLRERGASAAHAGCLAAVRSFRGLIIAYSFRRALSSVWRRRPVRSPLDLGGPDMS